MDRLESFKEKNQENNCMYRLYVYTSVFKEWTEDTSSLYFCKMGRPRIFSQKLSGIFSGKIKRNVCENTHNFYDIFFREDGPRFC